MAIRDVLKLLESLHKAGDKARSSEVMTSVGPNNARAYSAILAGKESTGQPAAMGTNVNGGVLLPGVRQFGGRDIVRVRLPDGTVQPFYRSTGENSGKPAEWLPFTGIGVQAGGQPWFAKDRYASGEMRSPAHPLHRFGTKELKTLSAALGSLSIASGAKDDFRNINTWLGTAESQRYNRTWKSLESQGLVNLPPLPEPVTDIPSAKGYPAIQGEPAPTSQAAIPQQQTHKIEQNKLLEALKRLTEAVKEANRPRRTVAQDIKGLSWGERWMRLEETGQLLSEDEVKAATLKERVSKRDVIRESERREQQKRDRENATPPPGGLLGAILSLGQSLWRSGAAGGGGGGGAAAGAAGAGSAGMGGAVARLAGLAANPYVVAGTAVAGFAVAAGKLPRITERLGAGLMEAQRPLAIFSASIAATVTRMDYQKRVLDMHTARATSGSASLVGNSLMQLRSEMQPMREAMTTVKNLAVHGLIQFGRLVNSIWGWIPGVKQIGEYLKNIEKKLGGGEPNRALNDHLRAIASGAWLEPKNRKPGERKNARKKED